MSVKNCRLCGAETPCGFNIKFKLVPICEACAEAIFMQQAKWYVEQDRERRLPEHGKEVSALQYRYGFDLRFSMYVDQLWGMVSDEERASFVDGVQGMGALYGGPDGLVDVIDRINDISRGK